jgi:RsmE family RNA methyltransferase
VNIVLFEPNELLAPLPLSDVRATHIIDVLRREKGDSFDAGIVDGPRGKAKVHTVTPAGITLSFSWQAEPPPLPPIDLIVGMSRPQTCRKILNEATTLGVASMAFVQTERGEPSYAKSTLWSSGEWRRHLVEGAAQAFCTRLPSVIHGPKLSEFLAAQNAANVKIALDNYEASLGLAAAFQAGIASRSTNQVQGLSLAIGSERGWSPAERNALTASDFILAHLGPRVLRTETAVVAALAVVKANFDWA